MILHQRTLYFKALGKYRYLSYLLPRIYLYDWQEMLRSWTATLHLAIDIFVHSQPCNPDHLAEGLDSLDVIPYGNPLYFSLLNYLLLVSYEIHERIFDPLRFFLYHFDKLNSCCWRFNRRSRWICWSSIRKSTRQLLVLMPSRESNSIFFFVLLYINQMAMMVLLLTVGALTTIYPQHAIYARYGSRTKLTIKAYGHSRWERRRWELVLRYDDTPNVWYNLPLITLVMTVRIPRYIWYEL